MNTLFSDELAATWSRQSDAPIRFSVEMKSKTEEVHEAIKLEGWNPETLEIVNNFESLNVSIDPAANEMIVMRGMKREGAEGEVKLGTELLPELAKQVWYRPPSWVDEYPRTNAILNSMAEKFETTRTDREVTTIIRRPEGLAEAVAEFSERSTAKRKELERKRNERTRRK